MRGGNAQRSAFNARSWADPAPSKQAASSRFKRRANPPAWTPCAAVPRRGVILSRSVASTASVTSVSWAASARSQPKRRHRRRSVSAAIARRPATTSRSRRSRSGCATGCPLETHPEPVVHANAVLPTPVARERVGQIARRPPGVHRGCPRELANVAAGPTRCSRCRRTRWPPARRLGVAIPRGHGQSLIVTSRVISVKRGSAESGMGISLPPGIGVQPPRQWWPTPRVLRGRLEDRPAGAVEIVEAIHDPQDLVGSDLSLEVRVRPLDGEEVQADDPLAAGIDDDDSRPGAMPESRRAPVRRGSRAGRAGRARAPRRDPGR
jgi:hypothetical protein